MYVLCTYLCMYACIWMLVFLYVHVCRHMYICVTCVCMSAFMHMDVHAFYVYMYVHTHIYMHIDVYTCVSLHVFWFKCTPFWMSERRPTDLGSQNNSHTYTHILLRGLGKQTALSELVFLLGMWGRWNPPLSVGPQARGHGSEFRPDGHSKNSLQPAATPVPLLCGWADPGEPRGSSGSPEVSHRGC